MVFLGGPVGKMRTCAIFEHARDHVAYASNPKFKEAINVGLFFNEDAALDSCGSQSNRNFAYTELSDTNKIKVVVASKLFTQNRTTISAIMAHEFGHVVLFIMGKLDHTEREADAMAEKIFKNKIYYDSSGIQCYRSGTRPRPDWIDEGRC